MSREPSHPDRTDPGAPAAGRDTAGPDTAGRDTAGRDGTAAAAHDPAAYGEAFADVYDEWYATLGDPALVVEALEALASGLAPSRRTVVELGAGTGRLALPLAAAGWRVVAVDASPSMLAILRRRTGEWQHLIDSAGGSIAVVEGDVAAAATWSAIDDLTRSGSPVAFVLAAFNLLLNLPDRTSQAVTVAQAAAALGPGGALVCETQFLHLDVAPPRAMAERPDGVRIHTSVDAARGIVRGRHVDPATGIERPWRLCALAIEELEAMATVAGLVTEHRWAAWDRTPLRPGPVPSAVTVHRLVP